MKTFRTRLRSADAPRLPRRLAVGALALAAVVSTLTLSTPVAPAEAAEDSAITVKWAGGNATELQQYQPDHAALKDNGSGHFDEYKDLQVSVSKTSNLQTEAVEVTVSGMAGTTALQLGTTNANVGNFVQVFQCWGADPDAVDFKETCQYGSWSTAAGGGDAENQAVRVGSGAVDRGTIPGTTTPVPFRSVTGSVSEPYTVETSPGIVVERSGIGVFFTPSISNEVPVGYLNASGPTTIPFEVQSAAAQPHLGCGDPSSLAGSRCWLVVVPRGTYSGELSAGKSDCKRQSFELAFPFGEKVLRQEASPMSPSCSFWEDRLVVPLEFMNAYATCPAAVAERRIVGSELAIAAISSWQSTLCTTGEAATFNLTTSAGRVVRDQLITGQAAFALTNKPLTPTTVNAGNADLLGEADLRYAPVLNTGLAIGFVADNTKEEYRDIKLTPRLLAKLLTQSYKIQLPHKLNTYSADPEATYITDGRPVTLRSDPEWSSIGNPSVGPTNGVTLVTSGPSGDDAIAAMWAYIRADADARAFLQGEPDPWGMTINPSYLPSTNENAFRGGLPYDLASDETVDTFPVADQTFIDYTTIQLDSLSALPQATNLAENASRVFRLETKHSSEFDEVNQVFVRSGPQPRGIGGVEGRAVFGPVTTGDAARLSLSTASLQLPSATPVFDTKTPFLEELNFVSATPEALAKGVDGLIIDPATGTAQMDFDNLATDAYPLAMTLSAAVNLNAPELDAAARAEYAHFLRYAAAEGQVPGDMRGQLPDGFVPLSTSQKAATLLLADTLVAAPTSGVVPASPPAVQVAPVTVVATTPNTANPVAASGLTTPTTLAAGGPTVSSAEDTLAASPTASIVGSSALGGSLIAGVAGLLSSVFLLRRRSLG